MTQAETKKVNLRNELKHLYGPTAKEVVEMDVPEMCFLMVDGAGDPNTSEAFKEAVEALYALSYALKFAVKKEGGGDYGIMPLEGLWRTEGRRGSFEEMQRDKDAWKWTTMMMQPEWVDRELYERALESPGGRRTFPVCGG